MLHPVGKERWTAQTAIMKLSQADVDSQSSIVASSDLGASRSGGGAAMGDGQTHGQSKALVLRTPGSGGSGGGGRDGGAGVLGDLAHADGNLQAPQYPFLSAPTRGRSYQHPQPAPYGLVSRYQADFEEVEFLGEGGFGKVVKAKNKLDGRFYAIKKIKLRPEDNEQKVFREVNALSRLNHQFIVRYVLLSTCGLADRC